jgi:hypothetical protein
MDVNGIIGNVWDVLSNLFGMNGICQWDALLLGLLHDPIFYEP